MPLLFSPVYSLTYLLQFQSFFYLEFSWGCTPPPLSHGVCHTLAIVGYLSLWKHVGEVALQPAFSSWLVIYSLCGGLPLPHSPELREPCPLCYVSFYFSQLLIYYSVIFLFSLRRGQSVQGAMMICTGVLHLHATYLLTWWSPKQGRSWHLVVQEPSWFLHLTWQGMLCGAGGVGVSEFCLFLVFFPARCISSISP
jgi:hypothetical protein